MIDKQRNTRLLHQGFGYTAEDEFRYASFPIRPHGKQTNFIFSDVGQNGFIDPASQLDFLRLYSISTKVIAEPSEQLYSTTCIIVDIQESDVTLIPDMKQEKHLNCFGNLDAVIVSDEHFLICLTESGTARTGVNPL